MAHNVMGVVSHNYLMKGRKKLGQGFHIEKVQIAKRTRFHEKKIQNK
jgi:hypothetical protein